MGAYAYCRICGRSLPGPWDLTTEHIMLQLFNPDAGVKCLSCDYEHNDYNRSDLITELAERVDKRKE